VTPRTTVERDFDFANHGSVCLLTPLTETAHDWASEHLPEDAMRWGQCSFVIEPRYVQAIVDALLEDGLTMAGAERQGGE
jgi:hypothetical protein